MFFVETTVMQDLCLITELFGGMFLLGYFVWSFGIRRKRLNRVVPGDKALYFSNKKRYHDELRDVFATTPQVVGNVAAMVVAEVILAATLLMAMKFGSFNYYVTQAALTVMSVSCVTYLFSMEQMNTLLSPSITEGEIFRLYEEAVWLKFVGFVGLWISVLLLMLLTSDVISVGISTVVTVVVTVRHFEARWERPSEKKRIYME